MKLHKEEFHRSYPSANIISVIVSRNTRWVDM